MLRIYIPAFFFDTSAVRIGYTDTVSVLNTEQFRNETMENLKGLNSEQLEHINAIVRDMKK